MLNNQLGGFMIEVWKRKETSEKLKIPVKTLDYLVSTGQIPFSRIGKRSVRFQSNRIEEWLIEREGVEFRQNRQNKK
jgi:excisionase family DNA binding protein